MNIIGAIERLIGMVVLGFIYFHVMIFLLNDILCKILHIPKKRLTIAVDFDGTIVKNAWPEIGEPRFLAFAVLRWLKKRGHCLILWTCRECRIDGDFDAWDDDNCFLCSTEIFLETNRVLFDYYNQNSEELKKVYGNDTRKVGADWYIDDKAGFLGWWSIPFIILWLERTVKK
jgi:hypothetical protein